MYSVLFASVFLLAYGIFAVPVFAVDISDSTSVTITAVVESAVITTTTSGGGGGGGGGGGITISNWTLPKASQDEKKRIFKIADFNHDGVVDLSDLSILLFHYQHPEKGIKLYDLNNDGVLDIGDVSIMLYYWDITS